MNILILGANGFIGSNLSEYILKNFPNWHIYAMDVRSDRLNNCLGKPNFNFVEGDITINLEWLEYNIKKSDVVLPLVAIATPSIYVKNPLAVFELDFEANLAIVRWCVRYKKRIVFPSTSEVYGMNPETEYNEESSNCVTGPINKPRWIYSTCKQLMDRVIHAYGDRDDLDFTLFRPFNWFGPGLDNPHDTKEGSSRVVSSFLSAIINKTNITLVDGGKQKRCFLYVDDGIEALAKIIENKNGVASKRIFNIGNPQDEYSMAELADDMLAIASKINGYENIHNIVSIKTQSGEAYYGKGYQDLLARVPCIENAKEHLAWNPKSTMKEGLEKTIKYYLIDK